MKKEQAKGFVAGLLVAVMALGLIGTAAATIGKRTVEVDYTDIKIELNGEKVTPVDANGDVVEPFAINGTTYLPVRAVSNALGLDVGWDGATSTVKLSEKKAEKRMDAIGTIALYKDIEDAAEYGTQSLDRLMMRMVGNLGGLEESAETLSAMDDITEDIALLNSMFYDGTNTKSSLAARGNVGEELNNAGASMAYLVQGTQHLETAKTHASAFLLYGDMNDYTNFSMYCSLASNCFRNCKNVASERFDFMVNNFDAT